MFGHALMVLGITSVLAGGPPLSHDQAPLDDAHRSNTAARLDRLVTDLARSMRHSMTPRPALSGEALYRARTRPGAIARFWVGGAIDRLLIFLTPGSHLPMLGVAQFAILTQVPVAGEYSSDFGFRVHPISKRRKLHTGLDFDASRGTLVRAAGAGEVTYAKRRGTYGNLVVITHGLGLETRYAHLRRIRVKPGQFVTAGTVVGTVGSTGRSTGPHLHFEVRQFGEPVDPKWAMGLREPTQVDELSATWRWIVDGRRQRNMR